MTPTRPQFPICKGDGNSTFSKGYRGIQPSSLPSERPHSRAGRPVGSFHANTGVERNSLLVTSPDGPISGALYVQQEF